MSSVTKPSVVTLLTVLLSIALWMWNTQTFNYMPSIWLFIFAWFVAVTLHELGHVLVGIGHKMAFISFTIGPVTISKDGKRVRIEENRSWMFYGGVAVLNFSEEYCHKSLFWMTIGGPLFSIVFTCIFGGLSLITDGSYFLPFCIMNGVIFLATIIPSKGSDGAHLLAFLKGGDEAKQKLDRAMVEKELMSREEPKNWKVEQMKHQLDPTHVPHLMLLIYYYAHKEEYKQTQLYIEKGLQLPPTKEMKYALSFFYNMEVLHQFLFGKPSLDEMKNAISHVLKIDLYSYYRTKAIVSYMEQKFDEADEYMRKADKLLQRHARSGLGFWVAEQHLFGLLQEKMANEDVLFHTNHIL
ncbi:M50 family metallopeptidase [Priestia koreensis]|uniref:Peptidase M50 domain-containing protein n=1 Tax=Priestia koreensis TaxID=284581 RepID=A0A0M0KXE2_9BACI|nr:M50 family metallopeptidase [Priestia koreensis]KOO43480.1 hypothetical protein AMD01_15775 [Priestia koreensis]